MSEMTIEELEEYKKKKVEELKKELEEHPPKFLEFRLDISSIDYYFTFPFITDIDIKEIRRCGKNWAVLLQRSLKRGEKFTRVLYECCGHACGATSKKLLGYASAFLYLCWNGPVDEWTLMNLTGEFVGEGYVLD